MALNVTKGKIVRPQKVVIYGSEGIGKTTLASQFPDPLFIDTEGGSSNMDVARVDRPENWYDLISTINEIGQTPDICKTLVIDTADWSETLMIQYICDRYGKTGIEDFGYGKGYTYAAEEFSNFLKCCDWVISTGKHVVITAHAKMRKFELPDEQGQFDRWEMKLSKNVAPMLKEWADLLLFLNYETTVIEGKATGGSRVMYTSHHPCWDAKNRHGLADKLPMDYNKIRHIFEGDPKK